MKDETNLNLSATDVNSDVECPKEEAQMATNQAADGQLKRSVENGAAWVLGSAEDLYEILQRLSRQHESASKVAGLRAFLGSLVPQLEVLHESLHGLVVAAEAWEARLAREEPGDGALDSSSDEHLSDKRGDVA